MLMFNRTAAPAPTDRLRNGQSVGTGVVEGPKI